MIFSFCSNDIIFAFTARKGNIIAPAISLVYEFHLPDRANIIEKTLKAFFQHQPRALTAVTTLLIAMT